MSRWYWSGLAAGLLLVCQTVGWATVYNLTPADDWYSVIGGSGLSPGDEVILGAGTYTRSSNINIAQRGTAADPIVIRAADGAQVIFTHDISHNIMQLTGAQYLILRGLEFTGGSAAIRIYASGGYPAKFITIEDCHIYHPGANAITCNSTGDMYEGMIFRRNEINNTGGHAEGFYLGGNNNSATFYDGLIANNYIHDIIDDGNPNFQGDGIEIKDGSYNNMVRDNVIHDINYPGVLVYSSYGNARNVIQGNVIWNSGDNGIQAGEEATIINNIIMNSAGSEIACQPHQSAIPGNLTIVHNTLISQYGRNCVRIGDPGPGGISGPIEIANNAVYSSGLAISVTPVGVTVAGNVESFNLAADFEDVGNLNFFPTASSVLLDAGDVAYVVADDFNHTPRGGDLDVGAYVFDAGGNPGWAVGPDFKPEQLEAPIIEEVSPDPDSGTVDVEYVRQLVLAAGTAPITWTLLDGPGGAIVDQDGQVSGWTPQAGDAGLPFDFEVEASNNQGSDTEGWEVLVAAPPPVIGEVSPDPQDARIDEEYQVQLSLVQGGGVTWALLEGPAGAVVDQTGLVSDWTPQPWQIGKSYTFEVQATNAYGSDTESWQADVPPAVPGFLELGGVVVMEGENYHSNTPGTLPNVFTLRTDLFPVGDGYMATENLGNSVGAPDIETDSPRLSYTVNFTHTGTYWLWTRATGPDGGSDSFHYGLNGVAISSAYEDCIQAGGVGNFLWYNETPTHDRISFTIGAPGLYSFDIWMREDGAGLDRILLTNNSIYEPIGNGPVESPRGTSVAGDLDSDGDIDLDDLVELEAAMSGPGVATAVPEADLDGDSDCDMADIAIFMQNFSGSV